MRTVSSGQSFHARYMPGAPGRLPGPRPPPRRGLRSGRARRNALGARVNGYYPLAGHVITAGAGHVCGHWTIANKAHYVPDVTYGETATRVRPGPGPASWLLSVTSLSASSAKTGHAKSASTVRKIKHDTALLITVLGLNSPS
jgi:hypothetical protein